MIADWVLIVLVVLAVVLATAALAVALSRRPAAAPTESAETGDDRQRAAVVANPTKVAPGTRAEVTLVCVDLGWREPLWLETTVDDPGTGQTEEALRQGVDVVLACGGDGTVRTVAEVLAGTGTPMGLLPAGTGNLLARTIGTPLNSIASATRVALSGNDRKIDVGRIRVDDEPDDRVFLVMAGMGFDAAIMQNTPEALKGRVGPLAYVISGLRAIRGRRTRVRLRFDDGPLLDRQTRTVVVGNSGTLLGGLVLMPEAHIDDGRLDIVNLAPKGIPGWIAVAGRVITRTRRGHARVEHWQAREIEIEAESPQPSQLDGDPIGDVSRLSIRVESSSLVMRVPIPPPSDTPDPG
ncbi:diacylglycerol/lipid kinase family protein [Pseudonocardia humida]|uniref:NAD(+)/NADH kinase n=1 Tax=Pseudonocardia humida TaxID=2800819 RepID=A0ABT1A6P5_9PSEU|nr:diacylglycerol kinase family protein [Pseudonocardia humida]MCO1658687.1 NAD(+)/NADH kinase [Pseudonocardia humida]